uniref:NBS-containing resistance-like protein n=1 Tax=Tanacetum cinerariifolium TaxID=118510 RepID=A0A6L2P7D6_TANCI|nr:NBS-containing resistance-like protein [Tanacetum cinerariifolium]
MKILDSDFVLEIGLKGVDPKQLEGKEKEQEKRHQKFICLRGCTRKIKVKVWCDKRSEKVVTSYKESIEAADVDRVDLDSPSHFPFNSKACEKAIGDPKNFYGHEITQGTEILACHGPSLDSSRVNNEPIIEAQVIARVRKPTQICDGRNEGWDEKRLMINKWPCPLTSEWVTLSRSSEAEYRGVANVVAKTAWIPSLLRELHNPLFTDTLVYCDNVSAVYMSTNPVPQQHTKYIEIDIHFVHDMVARGLVSVLHVPSRHQYANIFTKGLPTALFEKFCTSLSVRSSPAQIAGEC